MYGKLVFFKYILRDRIDVAIKASSLSSLLRMCRIDMNWPTTPRCSVEFSWVFPPWPMAVAGKKEPVGLWGWGGFWHSREGGCAQPLSGRFFLLWQSTKTTESRKVWGPDGDPGQLWAVSLRPVPPKTFWLSAVGGGSVKCGPQQMCTQSSVILYARYRTSMLCSL